MTEKRDPFYIRTEARVTDDRQLVLKEGERGCVAFAGEVRTMEDGTRVAAFPVEVFNVLGAGDAFMAGFLRGWLRDAPIETCCRYANACGAIVVSRHGCAPAMPTYDELRHFLSCVENRSRPIVDLRDGTQSLLMALAAKKSIASGTVVEIRP